MTKVAFGGNPTGDRLQSVGRRTGRGHWPNRRSWHWADQEECPHIGQRPSASGHGSAIAEQSRPGPQEGNGNLAVSRSKDDKYIRALVARADNVGRVKIAKERSRDLKDAGLVREQAQRLFDDYGNTFTRTQRRAAAAEAIDAAFQCPPSVAPSVHCVTAGLRFISGLQDPTTGITNKYLSSPSHSGIARIIR